MRSFHGLRPLQVGMQKENLAYILHWDHSDNQVYNASCNSLFIVRQFFCRLPPWRADFAEQWHVCLRPPVNYTLFVMIQIRFEQRTEPPLYKAGTLVGYGMRGMACRCH